MTREDAVQKAQDRVRAKAAVVQRLQAARRDLRLPAELDYMQVGALSIEARQRLNKYRPETLGQASRLSGITPATISLLMVHLKKGGFKGFATTTAPEAA